MSWLAGSSGRELLTGLLFKAEAGDEEVITAADSSQLQEGLNHSGSGGGVGGGISICNSKFGLFLVVNAPW